ncbi:MULTISPECIES: peptidoglycan DD-metalloendopeptidase family protein [Gracilibacillus]|uniref:peptidoglycan DD-metalloendopeptidase family protein n=1 Tax=Gracilibacillus TaxID=74385 RepID=UPI0013D2D179|nr:peptidoglycan DD-metalloendopeptidase family protein [Gracilibacillus thailandensis]
MSGLAEQSMHTDNMPDKESQGNPIKKAGKIKKYLLIGGIVLSPFFLFICIGVFIIIMGMVVVLEVDDETSLSEYGAEEIPAEYIPIYQEAGEEFGVDWLILASIHRIETHFSTLDPMVSPVGAIGHTQFMPCTWIGWGYPACQSSSLGNANIPDSALTSPSLIAQYGGYGVDGNGNGKADPFEIEDSIYATAKYISANMNGEGEEALKSAIFAYNNADWYVEEVLHYYSLYADGYDGVEVVAEIKGDKAWVVPFTKNITSSFGTRTDPVDGTTKQHNGIDIAAGGVHGKPVVAYADGEVVYSQFNSGGYGYLVIIQHENNVKTYYGHLQRQGIPVGTKVKAGQVIGNVGSTGKSTGSHLHFEVRVNDNPVNPLPYLSDFLK